MNRAAPVAVFDLDGTLIDAVADIAAGVNRRLRAQGLDALSPAEATSLLGLGLRSFTQRAFGLRGSRIEEPEIDDVVREYIQAPVLHTRLYPQAAATLLLLRDQGWRLAVCTNKAEAAALNILRHFDLLRLFDGVCGGDAAPWRKPDPRHLQLTLERAGLAAHPAIMIGDHHADVAAAHGCGIPAVFAGWGYGTAQMAAEANAVATGLAELPALLPVVLTGAAVAQT